MKRALFLSAVLAFSFGVLSCGDDASDPKAWIGMLCEKYDTCGYLSDPIMSAMFGTNQSECESKMNQMIASNPNAKVEPDANKCPNTDADACFSAYKALSCDDLKKGTQPAACACK